jgi:hypothetical protein
MLTTDLHYAMTFLNPYLLGETRLHDDANAKVLNRVLQLTRTPTTYALTLRDLWKIEVHFLTPPNERPRFVPTQVVGFDWSWWTHTCTHHSLHFGASVFYIIVQMELEFIFICLQQSVKSINIGSNKKPGVHIH